MVKSKKSKTTGKEDDTDEDISGVGDSVKDSKNTLKDMEETKGKKEKKSKKDKKKDDFESDEEEALVKKEKKSKKGKKKDDFDSDDESYGKKKTKKSSRFAEDSDEEDDVNDTARRKGKTKTLDSDEDEDAEKGMKKKSKKEKKKKGKHDDDDFDDEEEGFGKKKEKKKGDESDDEADKVTKKKADKKKAKKKGGDDFDDDFDDEIASLTTKIKGTTISKKKNKLDKIKNHGDSFDEDDEDFPEESEPVKKSKVKAKQKLRPGFESLQLEDDKSDDDVQPQRPDTPEEDATEKSKKSAPAKGDKKGKKSRKRKDEDDEDIEKVLAELEMEYAGLTVKDESKPSEAPQEEKPSKKAGKKKKKENLEAEIMSELKETENIDVDADEEEKPAPKKKEKKEKKAKKEDSAKDKKAKEKVEETKAAEDAGEDDDSKDKKKKKGKEKDEKPKKGPGSKAIAAMQEALRKMKEEEERLKREEEERIKREEEAEAARLEALRLEKERKEKKKQKEKERKERLKAEGKFLTAKQKADKLRAQEMINALKAQGLEIPDPGEKKVRPGTRIKTNKSKVLATQNSSEGNDLNSNDSAAVPPPEQIQVEIVDKKAETKEESDESDVKDTWDADSSEDEDTSEKTDANPPPPKVQKQDSKETTDSKPPTKVQKQESKEKESEEESESEEDDESEEDSSDEETDSEVELKTEAEKKRERALARIEKRKEEAEKNRSLDNLRAAVVCVLGHVDTGKTKILDKLRRTHVQDGEAGGITQQIGATNVPIDNIKETCKLVKGFSDMDLKIPGLLIIDTPGHESFSNLRSRGSSLCDIAILVVDIMHGLEPQTIESINLLKSRKTPFIVALNKIDRLYDWQTGGRKDIRDILKTQATNTQFEFKERAKEVIVQFAEQGLNAAIFFENPNPRSYVSLVPTSAITGEGMGNLLALIVEYCQNMLPKRLMYSDLLLATVLEVKAIPGLGTTIDCILINGKLAEGDTIILAGTDGPIVTQIRSLLMPQPMKELRVKNAYIEYKEIKAAQGVKIAAKDLEKAIAGLNLQVAEKPDEIPIFCDLVAKELKTALSSIKLKERGVYVQASTLGSLEALLEFLRTSKIPYSGIKIGPVVKKDVMKASIMLEHDSQYATILAFDVKIERDAQELADSLGVKIFQADIIYHLFDKFMAYREELKQKKRDEFKNIAVFPCKLRILPQYVFNTRDPIVVGVIVEAGIVKEGTPLCVPSKEFINLGVVTSVEVNHKAMESARKGMEVCIKIENVPGETPKLYGRHFDHTDLLTSKISRQSIDACKEYFRDDLTKQDWQLMVELKKLFEIL